VTCGVVELEARLKLPRLRGREAVEVWSFTKSSNDQTAVSADRPSRGISYVRVLWSGDALDESFDLGGVTRVRLYVGW
jgi:hypothetical protein